MSGRSVCLTPANDVVADLLHLYVQQIRDHVVPGEGVLDRKLPQFARDTNLRDVSPKHRGLFVGFCGLLCGGRRPAARLLCSPHANPSPSPRLVAPPLGGARFARPADHHTGDRPVRRPPLQFGRRLPGPDPARPT
jgi:hypothetical protein